MWVGIVSNMVNRCIRIPPQRKVSELERGHSVKAIYGHMIGNVSDIKICSIETLEQL